MCRLKKRYICATVLYCGLIFLLSSQSDPRAADWGFLAFPGADKLVHGLLYAGLAAVVSVGVWRSNETIRASLHFWIPITFAVIYGFSDEVHQIYVPERTFDWMDLLALLKDGYFPDFCEVPEWLADDNLDAVNDRQLKKLAKKMFREHGESDKATKAHGEFIEWLEENDPVLAEETKNGDHVIF